MKKQSGFRRLVALALTLCMLAALTAEIFAADIVDSGHCGGEGDGKNLTWTLDSEGTLTIYGNGKMADYEYHGGPWASTKVKSVSIKSGVTCIGDYAFYNCTNLTGVTLPNSVTSIGKGAFSYCSSLASITIPSSVTSIGAAAFSHCSSLTSVTIPNSVTSIGGSAFSCCSSLKSITIPNSVTSIGRSAFYDCSSLTSITIPSSVTSVGEYAFFDCSSLTSVTIPNSVTSIGDSAFEACSSLTSVTISKSVSSIGRNAFARCRELERAYFYGNAPGVWPNTFSGCESTFCIYYMPGTTGWTDSSAYDAEKGTWNGYLLKTWDGKTIPEETKTSVPTGKYCIRAIDESGNPVSDATVWWNGSRAVTDENGDAFVDLTTVGEPVIRVVKSGYIEWTNKNSNWKKSDTRFERVISTLKAMVN